MSPRKKSIIGTFSAVPSKSRKSQSSANLQIAVLVVLLLILLATLYPVGKTIRMNHRLEAELKDLKLDLEAHQEALKISRKKCDAKIRIFEDNEVKFKETINYYKEAEARLSKDWCQPITEKAMAEYKQVCQKTIDDYSGRVEKLAKERDTAMKRLEPVAMCCKSATVQNKALLSGLSEEAAQRKGAEAVAASVRAIEKPNSLRSHTQKVVWHPKGEQLRGEKPLKTKRGPQKPFRVTSAGLGEEKDMLGRAGHGSDDAHANNVDANRNDEAGDDEAGDETEDSR